MNYLQLAQRLRQEVGIAGTGPSAVTNQTGELKRLVDWIATSWDDIQRLRNDWNWLKGTFSFTTTANDDRYTSAEAGIASRFDHWDENMVRVYSSSVNDETELVFLPYEDWRAIYRVGTQSPSRPVHFSYDPATKDLLLGYKPDAVYTISGEYFKNIQTLDDDADEPEMPAKYHMAIVYKAMMKYARYNAAGEIYDDAKIEYNKIRAELEGRELPQTLMAGPLA